MLFSNRYNPPEGYYTSWDGTPMRFHKVLVYGLNALSIVFSIVSIFTMTWSGLDYTGLDFEVMLDFVLTLVTLGLAVASIILVRGYSWMGIRLFFYRYFISIFYALFSFVYCEIKYDLSGTMSGRDTIENIFIQIIGSVVFCVIAYLYYRKRRLLFIPKPEMKTAPTQTDITKGVD